MDSCSKRDGDDDYYGCSAYRHPHHTPTSMMSLTASVIQDLFQELSPLLNNDDESTASRNSAASLTTPSFPLVTHTVDDDSILTTNDDKRWYDDWPNKTRG